MNEHGALWNSRFGWAFWLGLHWPAQARLPFRSRAVIERQQRSRLTQTVSHAYRHVPHYREAMARLGLDPGDISTAGDLARLPMIQRVDVQRDPERFVSTARPIESHVPLQSGGST
jgi:phenylacetate-CoA ligase